MSEQFEPNDVLDFWFGLTDEQYFTKDLELDEEITRRFKTHHEAAKRGELDHWQETPKGTLALIILLDQFARNMYRDSPLAFAADPKALSLATAAVEKGVDMELPVASRQWIYLPFEHSENLADQERSVELFKRLDFNDTLKWAQDHLDIIRRFNRFPHRNAILNRETTPEEQKFLDDGGFAG